MAHFYGTVLGKSGSEASRTGSKKAGLQVSAKSWQGEVCVELRHDATNDRDMVRITVGQHNDARFVLYDGAVEALATGHYCARLVREVA